MRVPSVYAARYEKARLIDPVLAGSYVALTRVGDPPVDAVMSDLEPLGQKEAARLLGGAIEQNEEVLRDAPASLQHLIHEVTRVPVVRPTGGPVRVSGVLQAPTTFWPPTSLARSWKASPR